MHAIQTFIPVSNSFIIFILLSFNFITWTWMIKMKKKGEVIYNFTNQAYFSPSFHNTPLIPLKQTMRTLFTTMNTH